MASNGNIGGFSGQWGQGSLISKKRKLLEAEGVEFDNKGKIKSPFMMSEIPKAIKLGDKEKDKVAITHCPTKKQKTSVDTSSNGCRSKNFAGTAKKESKGGEIVNKPSSGPTDSEIREVTLTMVSERAVGKTC